MIHKIICFQSTAVIYNMFVAFTTRKTQHLQHLSENWSFKNVCTNWLLHLPKTYVLFYSMFFNKLPHLSKTYVLFYNNLSMTYFLFYNNLFYKLKHP